MKKLLFVLSAAALLFAGCAKEMLQVNGESGEQTTVTFTVNASGAASKASLDNDGAAANVNHWVMEVRDAQNDLFYRDEKDATAGVLTQTFTFKLFKNQTYNIQFWADTKGSYNTDDLTAVSTVGTVGNLDSRDAFSANVVYKSERAEAVSVTLRRPFAQLNIVTTDLAAMKATATTAYGKYAPTDLVVIATVPTTFNVKTQEAGAAEPQVITADASYADFAAGAAKTTIFMDYIFASASEKDLVDILFSCKSNGNEIEYTFPSIPLQRNYRTNINGDLFSNTTKWTVTIDPTWYTPEYNVDFYEATVDNIEALNTVLSSDEAAAAKSVSVTATMPSDSDSKDVTFTNKNNDQAIDINIVGTLGSANTVTFKNDTDPTTEGPATLNVSAPSGTTIVFENVMNHVVINGTVYENVSGAFSANTLVVEAGVTVKNLTIAAGGLEIYGTVNNVSVTGTKETVFVRNCVGLSESVYNVLKNYIAPGYTGVQNGEKWDIVLDNNWTSHAAKEFSQIDEDSKIICIISAEELALFAKTLNEGVSYKGWNVVLGQDINLAAYNWVPANLTSDNFTFDGNGRSINGLKINSEKSYSAFFGECSASGLVIKNVTFVNPSVNSTGLDYTAVLAAHCYATVDNCSVIGGTVEGKEQVGAIVGYLWCGTVKNCTVDGTTVSGVNRVGGVAGKANVDSEFRILGNVVKNANISATERHDLSGAAGVVAQIMTGKTSVWEVKDNVVVDVKTTTGNDATFVPVGEFRKGCFAADAVSAGHITGNEWYPEGVGYYEMKNPENAAEKVRIINAAFEPAFKIGETSYFTLGEAVAAAKAGAIINIVKTGEYSFVNIPENITVSGKKGVKFNCLGGGSIASVPNGATFENIELILGASSYHGFYQAGKLVFNGCTIDGLLFAYGNIDFNKTTFTNKEGYCMWTYGAEKINYNSCTFNTYAGKAINVYCEATENRPCYYTFTECTFTNLSHKMSGEEDQCKPGLAIKNNGNGTSGTKPSYYDITLTKCTFDGFGQSDGDLMGFPTEKPYVNAYGYNSATSPLKVTVDDVVKVNIQ